nr:unnamed protein product [Digitaria exilis]
MAGRSRYENPFEEGGADEVNPFADQAKRGAPAAQSSYSGGAFYTTQSRPAPPSTRLSPLPPEPADFYNDFATPVDIPMDTNKDMKTREKELLAKEAELNRREKILYFVGFGLFCLESLLSMWVIQRVYRYFRGSGKEAEMKREAARSAARAAF